ncbi:MAG: hypothetical protein E6J41_03445 [Chloroflexi bacterium]|nr:MAG: hypothetical protein E6J41_03445 [Chloroflexota bacterium]
MPHTPAAGPEAEGDVERKLERVRRAIAHSEATLAQLRTLEARATAALERARTAAARGARPRLSSS